MSMQSRRDSYLIELSGRLRVAGNTATAELIDGVLSEMQANHWYEMSLNLLRAIRDPMVLEVAYELHENVLGAIRADISPILYVKLVYFVAFSPKSTMESALTVVEGAANMLRSPEGSQCKYMMQCIHALVLLEYNTDDYNALSATPGSNAYTVRKLLAEVDEYVRTLPMHEVEPLLVALQCRAHGRDYELRRQYTKYYKNAFDIYTYMEKAEMPIVDAEVTALAYKTAIAALLAEGVFNFGKFLNFKPFVSRLTAAPEYVWLLECIQRCNEGDVQGFERFYQQHADDAARVANLSNVSEALFRKIRLMALLHLVFYTPFNERVFTFDAIAQRCSVAADQAEPLLLAALAQGIIKGRMDGMTREIHVTWVEPRVLSLHEVKELAVHMSRWREQVESIHHNLHALTNTA